MQQSTLYLEKLVEILVKHIKSYIYKNILIVIIIKINDRTKKKE
jgi:hypothetical protein